jgi:outer membrane immunogenic protein
MRNLKFIVSTAAVVGALAGITAASAADIAPRAYTKAPVMVEPAFNWSGFYAGGNIGYSWGSSSNTQTIANANTGVVLFTNTASNNANGVIGGGQVGYNWQASNWLFGLETDIQGSGEKGSLALVCVACNTDGSNITSVLNQNLNWFGTVRGRVGALVTPTVLLYGTGGLAYGGFSTSGSITGNNVNGVPATFVFPGTSSTRAGWTLGAGIEGRISGNWTAKLEYLYMDLGTVNAGTTATTILVPVRTNAGAAYSSHFTDNIVRVGVNYLFNSPVVARY